MTGTEKWARPMALIEKWEPFAPGLMAVIVGILYFLTMSPTIGHTDSGELDAVAYTFGVAHPTGYPLFTLLGWIFTRIPIGTIAWRMNFMCLLFVVGSAWVWAKFLREFFILMRTTVKKGDSSYALRIKVANLAGTVLGTLMLCFGRTWWMQSTSSEVYSLQCLLLAVMLWTLLKAWHSKEKVFKAWAIFAVVLALCFTNHLTSIILLPGTLYLFFVRFGFKGSAIKNGLGLAGIGLGVLVVFYGMLMLVAAAHPAYNWGNPEDWPRLWHHISGKQFSVWMFNGPKAFGKNFVAYLNRLPNEFGWDLIWPKIPIWIGLGAMVFQGMTYALQRRREWAIFFGVGFLSNVFWAANYSIKDPEPYFLFSFMTIAFLGAMLLRWSWIGMKKVAPFLSGAFLIVIGFQVFWNFGVNNQRGAYQYEDYARATLASLPENAIVVSKAWDVFVGPASYLQGCEGFRTDVAIVDYSLLHDRHWYAQQLKVQDPELAKALGVRLDEWEKAVYDFDIKGKVNPAVLGPRFDAVYNGILSQLNTRPVFLAPEMLTAFSNGEIAPPPSGWVPLPSRYLVQLIPAENAAQYVPIAAANNPIRFGGDEDEYEYRLLKNFLAQSLNFRANYDQQNGKTAEAEALRAEVKALNVKPIQPRE
jgi:hypothetical protein